MNCFVDKERLSIGIEEAGRGPLFGPVYASAVMWVDDLSNYKDELREINCETLETFDSKKISKKKREDLADFIKRNAMDYAYSFCEPWEIDKINIRNATLKAMHNALEKIELPYEYLYIDGNYFTPDKNWTPFSCIPQGDRSHLAIGMASILAKVEHDKHIQDIVAKYPEYDEYYGLSSNMGYGTQAHLHGLEKYGKTPFHRHSFKPVKDINVIIS